MQLPEDLFSDQHLEELLREIQREIGRRGMSDRIQREEVLSLMLFPCSSDDKYLPDDCTWTSFLQKVLAEPKPTEMSWSAFLQVILNVTRAEITRRGIENRVDAADVILHILPELKDERGVSVSQDEGWREITKLRFAARKAPEIPWSVFLKWEIHNTFRTHFRRLTREDSRAVPFQMEVGEAESDYCESAPQAFGVNPNDLAEDDALARLTELADWAVRDLVKSGFITAGPKADHIRELVLEFMNSNHGESWARLSKELTTGDGQWSSHKRAFQKNFGRWRGEIMSYLRNRYEAEMRMVTGRSK